MIRKLFNLFKKKPIELTLPDDFGDGNQPQYIFIDPETIRRIRLIDAEYQAKFKSYKVVKKDV